MPRFNYPAEAVAAATGIDLVRDPWLPERSIWPRLGVVGAGLGEPWLTSASQLTEPGLVARSDR